MIIIYFFDFIAIHTSYALTFFDRYSSVSGFHNAFTCEVERRSKTFGINDFSPDAIEFYRIALPDRDCEFLVFLLTKAPKPCNFNIFRRVIHIDPFHPKFRCRPGIASANQDTQ